MEDLDLPMEIIEEIIKDFSFADLPACALTCRSFVIPSQRALFRKVVLNHWHFNDISSYISSHEALESNPMLSQYVQVFSLKEPRMYTQHYISKQPNFPHVLSSFQNLNELRIDIPSCTYQTLSEGVQQALLEVLSLPSMVHFKLCGVNNLLPEAMIKMLSIPTVGLTNVRFQEKQPYWDRELDKNRNNSSIYAIKEMALGYQMILDDSIPLIDVMSLPGVQLAELAIRHVSGYECKIEVAREIINRQCQFLTSLKFPSNAIVDDGDILSMVPSKLFAHNLLPILDDMKLVDIGKMPMLQSISLFAEFSSGGGLSESIMLFSKIRENNVIQKIKMTIEFEKLDELTDADSWNNWKCFDKLLSGPKFSKLKKVQFRLSREFLKNINSRGSVPPKNEGLKTTIIDFLPMLHENGKLDVENVEVYD